MDRGGVGGAQPSAPNSENAASTMWGSMNRMRGGPGSTSGMFGPAGSGSMGHIPGRTRDSSAMGRPSMPPISNSRYGGGYFGDDDRRSMKSFYSEDARANALQTPSEQLNSLNHQLLQKENAKYPKSQLSQPNGFANGMSAGGAMPSAGVTTKQLQIERQLVEQQSVNQELERRLQAVQESFKQARAHHDQEVQVQRQNADKMEIAARENTTLAQQYLQQLQEKTKNVEQLTQHSTQLQQSAIQLQSQLQAKDQQLQMYLQDAQRAAQGNPVLHEAHVGRVLRMKVVELEEALGGRNKIIEMLQAEISSRETNLTEVTKMAHDLHAQVNSINEGKNVLQQKIEFEAARYSQERAQLNELIEQANVNAEKAQKDSQKVLEGKQREFDEKISETMKQLDLVQKQNETLELSQSELEKQLAENTEELEKSRVQAAKLQQDLAETTEILQQQLNKATENLSRDFATKQKAWAEERKRLDDGLQELTNQKFEVEQTLQKARIESENLAREYQSREKELTESLLAHQAELEKSQKQSIELAESLRLLQEDVNVKAASWGDEKRNVENAIQAANKDIETRFREMEQEKLGWESSKRNYENQIADLTSQNENLTKTLDELDKVTSEERDQLQTALMANSKEAQATTEKLSMQVDQLSKANMDLEYEKEQIERNWSDRFVQFESEWKDRVSKAQRNTDLVKSETERTAGDYDRRIEMLQNGFNEERSSMEARIKQLQGEIERERDAQDKIREEARAARIEVETASGKTESVTRALTREKKQLEEERNESNRLREKEREQFLAERAQLENYLRSVSEHVKALQDSSNQNTERFGEERVKFEAEMEQIRIESKLRESDLRKERDDLQIEQVRVKTQLKQEIENKTEEANILQGKVQRFEKARDELEAQIEKVSKEKNMLETMITELTEDSTTLERKLLAEKDEWNATRVSLEESIRQKNTQIEELTSQLLATNLKISETEAQTTELTKSKEQVISNLRKEVDQLQNDLDKAKIAHVEEMQNLKDAHNEDAKKMKDENAKKLGNLTQMLEGTKSDLLAQVAQTESKMNELVHGTTQAAEQERNMLLSEKEQILSQKSQEKNQFDSYIETLTGKLTSMNVLIEQKQTEIEKLQAEKSKLEADLLSTNGNFQATSEQLKTLHESAQSEIAKAQEEILKREVTIKSLNETLENERDAHQTTKREHALTKAAHEKLQNEIRIVNHKILKLCYKGLIIWAILLITF